MGISKDLIGIGTIVERRGQRRKVVDAGERFKLYFGQEDADCLQYEIIQSARKNRADLGRRGKCTRTSLASWAESVVEVGLGRRD